MNIIQRDIFVTRKDITVVIPYPQGGNAVPIYLRIADWQIPSGSTARIYMRKPSGAEIYNDCVINGNIVQITVTTQMTAEAGWVKSTLEIVNGTDILHSFEMILDVQATSISDNAVESKDEFTALENLVAEADQAVKDAETATEAANTAAGTANTAAGAANTAAGTANRAAQAANTAAGTANTAADNADDAADLANTAADAANTAASAANSAAQAANEAAEAVEGAVSGVIKDSQVSTLTTYSSQKIENDYVAKADRITELEIDALDDDISDIPDSENILMELTQKVEGKADSMSYDDGFLQLTSEGQKIGSAVNIPSGGGGGGSGTDIETISNQEIDMIFEEE